MDYGDLEQHLAGPLSITIGTRDAEHQPHFGRAFGARLDTAAGTLTVIAPAQLARRVLPDLRANGRAAINMGDMVNFRTRQVKGQLLSIADPGPEERALIDRWVEAALPIARQYFGDLFADAWAKIELNPSHAITVRIDELYNQTPGAGAGVRIG